MLHIAVTSGLQSNDRNGGADMTPANASLLLKEVRGLYSAKLGALKSSNKAYAADKPWDEVKKNEKWARRNRNQKESGEVQERIHGFIRGLPRAAHTPYILGSLLNQERVLLEDDLQKMAGNCGDMASVALYRGITYYGENPVQAFILSFKAADHTGVMKPGKKFGHELAFFGDCLGTEKNRAPSPHGLVVDPWANISCYYSDYAGKLNEKLQQWNDEEKSIKNFGRLDEKHWVKPLDPTLELVVMRPMAAKPSGFGQQAGLRTALAPGASLTIVGADQAWSLA
jgi:hypothetical protein